MLVIRIIIFGSIGLVGGLIAGFSQEGEMPSETSSAATSSAETPSTPGVINLTMAETLRRVEAENLNVLLSKEFVQQAIEAPGRIGRQDLGVVVEPDEPADAATQAHRQRLQGIADAAIDIEACELHAWCQLFLDRQARRSPAQDAQSMAIGRQRGGGSQEARIELEGVGGDDSDVQPARLGRVSSDGARPPRSAPITVMRGAQRPA